MEDKEKKDISMENKENTEEISENNRVSEIKKDNPEKKDKTLKENNKDKEKKSSEDNSEKSGKGFFAKLKDKFWVVSTIVLAIIVIILLFMSLGGDGITGSAVSSEAAGENLLGFTESQGLGDKAELKNIESFNDFFYKATLLIEGQELPVFVTKDGNYMVSEPVPLDNSAPEVVNQDNQQNTGASTVYSEEETAKLKEFNDCLAEEGLVIYGSETCPHCQNLIKTLGGYEAASSVYVECMENQQRCAEEMEGQGVPEIQINGEKFDEGRSIEVLAEATGCPVPEIQA